MNGWISGLASVTIASVAVGAAAIQETTAPFRPIPGGAEAAITDPPGTFRVELTRGWFEASEHAVSIRAERVEGEVVSRLHRIDDRKPWGVAGTSPQMELTGFTVRLGETDIAVPEALYSDLYEPSFVLDEDGRTLWAWPNVAEGRLVVKMIGGSEEAPYSVNWTLRTDGNHSREIYVDGVLVEDVTPPTSG